MAINYAYRYFFQLWQHKLWSSNAQKGMLLKQDGGKLIINESKDHKRFFYN
jgi:hypothetical protein